MAEVQISVAFANHRIETLPLAEAHMRAHEVVVLEEPPSPGFADMLAGRLAVDAYLDELELEFPLFARASCELWRSLAADGIELRQSDPYIKVLLSIHDLFDHEGRPEDIDAASLMGDVYRMEQGWGGALLGFYACCASPQFDQIVARLQRFARLDARRGRLRDRLRAAAIVQIANDFHSVYVEAGSLHLPLLADLCAQLGGEGHVRPIWVTEPVTRQVARCRQIMGPGDELTLRYAFRPGFSGPRAALLAARSLIHVKLLDKEEVLESTDSYPHIRRELEANRIVSRLSYADCQTLYPRVRSLAPEEARAVVGAYREVPGKFV
jgi:hypothetical protein